MTTTTETQLREALERLNCTMVEVCEPHWGNPSRTIIPIPRADLLAALAPTPSTTEPGEQMRSTLSDMLDKWHRHTCYPDALPFELDHAVEAIIAFLHPNNTGTARAEMGDGERPFPDLLSADEQKALLERAEYMWSRLQANDLGGYSGINRPFWIVAETLAMIEQFGHRDIGQRWSKDDLDAARAACRTERRITRWARS